MVLILKRRVLWDSAPCVHGDFTRTTKHFSATIQHNSDTTCLETVLEKAVKGSFLPGHPPSGKGADV